MKAEDLRECYQEWCASHGVQPLSGTEFGKVLAACGVESRKSNGRMVYVGVKLVNAVGEEGAA